jgi:hypothetical protein
VKVLQFYVVLSNYELRHVHVDQDTQQDLTTTFSREADRFLHNKEPINFVPSYLTAQAGEVLVARDFTLPENFAECVADPNHCDDMDPEDLNGRHVKALVGAIADDDGLVRRAIFKELSGARIIDQSPRNFFLRRSTLTRIDRPGLSVPEPVHAVYEGDDLYFHSYDTAKKFLDLAGIYSEAAREDVETFLRTAPVAFEGEGNLYDLTDSWSRRRISMIVADPVWERMSLREICNRAEALPFDVATRNSGTVLLLPNDRANLKEVIRFINQDIFRSILTDELHYAGSKVRLDN